MFDIEPADINQVKQTADGDTIIIEDDIQNVANDLNTIDKRLTLRFNPIQGFYAIYFKDEQKEYLVNTFKSLDQRVVTRIREIMQPDYDYVKEIEKQDFQADKDLQCEQDQRAGEAAEKLAFAIRRDLGVKDKAYFVNKD